MVALVFTQVDGQFVERGLDLCTAVISPSLDGSDNSLADMLIAGGISTGLKLDVHQIGGPDGSAAHVLKILNSTDAACLFGHELPCHDESFVKLGFRYALCAERIQALWLVEFDFLRVLNHRV